MRFAGKPFVTWLVTWFCTGLCTGNFAVHVRKLLLKSFEKILGKFLVHVPEIFLELFRELFTFAAVVCLALGRVCRAVFI